MIKNKFFEKKDLDIVSFRCLLKELEDIYINKLGQEKSIYGCKFKDKVKIQWSRDWEYPWAILNSRVKAGGKVLDCGCGGSPLLPFLSKFGCECYGIDPNIFDFKSKGKGNLWAFKQDPNELGFKIKFFEDSLDNMHFEDNFFDKVFCISVIEHLSKETALNGIKEMARVLKKGGLMILTIDNDGPHVTPELIGKYEELIKNSGLELYGESDFRKPNSEDVPGEYNVLGFVLKKN